MIPTITTHKTAIEGLEIKHYKNIRCDSGRTRKGAPIYHRETWTRYHVDGRDVGPIMRSLAEAWAGMNAYAQSYGLIY